MLGPSFSLVCFYSFNAVIVLLQWGSVMGGIKPFNITDLCLYPTKTAKKPGFLMFSGGIERDQWHGMG